MKNFKLFIALAFITMPFTGKSQMDLYDELMDSLLTQPIGSGLLMWIQPNTFSPGEGFEYYRTSSGDSANTAVLERTWIDDQLDMVHYQYRQHYEGLPVECATLIEHFSKDNELIYSNGKLATDLTMSVTPQLTEGDAKQQLINYLPASYTYAWLDSTWENELKISTGDPSATYEPTGELLIAIDNYAGLGFYIPSTRYRLAYKFRIRTVDPVISSTYYVDAMTGSVFKTVSHIQHDDFATVHNSGGAEERVIDTRWRGFPNYDFVLETNDDGVEIHTKFYDVDHSFPFRGEIDKNSEPWVGYEGNATSTHWYVQQSWNFFKSVYGRNGMDHDYGKIRVHVEREDGSINAEYLFDEDDWDNLTFNKFGAVHTGNYADIVGHEYTHGVIQHTSTLEYYSESGALNESYADIFGIMVKRFALDGGVGTPSWNFGDPTVIERSFSAPKSSGEHHWDDGWDCPSDDGQPDTYEGEYWQDIYEVCDNGGVHGNSGVQNHWFYLLSVGGSGMNDNDDTYNVTGIGIDKAARIAYTAMTSIDEAGQYADARALSIVAAKLLFGECSVEHYQTANAWYAVGVGDGSACDGVLTTTAQMKYGALTVYPNPVEGSFRVDWEGENNYSLKLYSLDGRIIYQKANIQNGQLIEIPILTNGVYMVELKSGDKKMLKKIVKS